MWLWFYSFQLFRQKLGLDYLIFTINLYSYLYFDTILCCSTSSRVPTMTTLATSAFFHYIVILWSFKLVIIKRINERRNQNKTVKSMSILKVTVIAKNENGVLSPYPIRNSRLELVHRGLKSPGQVIKSEITSNRALTWGLRLGGWILMYLGLSVMTRIVKTLGEQRVWRRNSLSCRQRIVAFPAISWVELDN